MIMYKISIIIPVYNVEKHLKKCLESLKKQSIGFENLEIIFIDDCSKDNSFNIIQEFSEKYSNVKVFQTSTNSGAAGKPRNIGLANATSEFVMFLDSDDIYFDNACEILYINMINSNAELVSGNYIKYENGKTIKFMDYKKNLKLTGNYLEIDNISECPDLLTLIPAFWVKIYRKSLLQDNNITFMENIVAEDLLFVCECLLCSKKTVYIDVPILKYEIREEELDDNNKSKSITATKNTKHLSDYIFVYTKLYELFKKYDDDFAWRAAIHLFFYTRELVLSQTSDMDKLNFLNHAQKLYEEFSKKYGPMLEYKTIFELIYSKRYAESIYISNLMNLKFNNDLRLLEDYNSNDIFILVDSIGDETFLNMIKQLIDSVSLCEKDILLINLESPLNDNVSNYLSSISNCQILYEEFRYHSLKIFNAFDYLAKIFSFDCPQDSTEKYEVFLEDEYVILYSEFPIESKTYFTKSKFTESEINKINEWINSNEHDFSKLDDIFKYKKKVILNQKLNEYHYIKTNFNEDKIKNEVLCTSDNFEFLNVKYKNSNMFINYNNRINDFELKFESFNDFKEYLITKNSFKCGSKPIILDLTNNQLLSKHNSSNISNLIIDKNTLIKHLENEVNGEYEYLNWLYLFNEKYLDLKIKTTHEISELYKNNSFNAIDTYQRNKNKLNEITDHINENKEEISKHKGELIWMNNKIKRMDEKISSIQKTKNHQEEIINSQVDKLNQNLVEFDEKSEIMGQKIKKRKIFIENQQKIINKNRELLEEAKTKEQEQEEMISNLKNTLEDYK